MDLFLKGEPKYIKVSSSALNHLVKQKVRNIINIYLIHYKKNI